MTKFGVVLGLSLSLASFAGSALAADINADTPISEIWGESAKPAAKPEKKATKQKVEKKLAKRRTPKAKKSDESAAGDRADEAPVAKQERPARGVASTEGSTRAPATPPTLEGAPTAKKETAPAPANKPFGGLMPVIESPKKKASEPVTRKESASADERSQAEAEPEHEHERAHGRAPASVEAAVALNKSQYNLFNPTPERSLREFYTDRPGKTADPYTVDAGHLQVEADAVSFRTSKRTEIEPDTGESVAVTAQRLTVSGINLRYGLTRVTDFEAEIESYVTETENIGETKSTESGMGDLRLRYKWNLVGADSEGSALAVMLMAKLPTNSLASENKKVEGGIGFPLGVKLSNRLDLRTMVEVDYARNLDDLGYHQEFISSIHLSDELFHGGSAFIEYFNQYSDGRGLGWVSSFDAGFQFEIAHDLKLDAALNIGLTSATADWNPVAGLAARF